MMEWGNAVLSISREFPGIKDSIGFGMQSRAELASGRTREGEENIAIIGTESEIGAFFFFTSIAFTSCACFYVHVCVLYFIIYMTRSTAVVRNPLTPRIFSSIIN